MEPSQDQPPSSEANEQSEQRPDLLAESHPGQVSVTAVEDAPAPIPQDQAPFDVDVAAETDSAYGDDFSSYSTSVTSSIRSYKYENGRRYHAYLEGQYSLPNDEEEQDRMDLLHHIFKLITGGELALAPIGKTPGRVLDFGTGTDMYPTAEVVGTDISPIQPTWVPNNCKFIIDDVEADWVYPPGEKFDYIHGRGMAGSIGDWGKLYKQCLNNLKPGGYLEMQEYECWLRADDDSLERARWVSEWLQTLDEASIKFGKRLNVSHMHGQWIKDAGFEAVEDRVFRVPVGSWPKDKGLKEVGRFEQLQMLDAADSFTLALYTRVLGKSIEETKTFIEGVKREFKDPSIHLYSFFHFVIARKPME